MGDLSSLRQGPYIPLAPLLSHFPGLPPSSDRPCPCFTPEESFQLGITRPPQFILLGS